jgi:hypothetical protein
MDVALLGVFRTHLQKALALSRYETVHFFPGRRNRARH